MLCYGAVLSIRTRIKDKRTGIVAGQIGMLNRVRKSKVMNIRINISNICEQMIGYQFIPFALPFLFLAFEVTFSDKYTDRSPTNHERKNATIPP